MGVGSGDSCDKPANHGARYGIVKRHGVIMHESGERGKQVEITSYRDGVRIGCTFVDSEALKEICEMHFRFLNSSDSVTHQSGY